MPWSEDQVPADLFLSHKGVNIYHTYKYDERSSGPSGTFFVTHQYDGQEEAFDASELSTYVPQDGRPTVSYEERIRQAIIAAIDKGEIVKHPDDFGPEVEDLRATQYLNSGAVKCPFCNSGHIESQGYKSSDTSTKEIEDVVICLDCNSKWKDTYTLTKVDLNYE